MSPSNKSHELYQTAMNRGTRHEDELADIARATHVAREARYAEARYAEGVSIDSKSYELALFYLRIYWKQLDSMTADEVAELTRKFALEIGDCATKFIEREREFRFLERERVVSKGAKE